MGSFLFRCYFFFLFRGKIYVAAVTDETDVTNPNSLVKISLEMIMSHRLAVLFMKLGFFFDKSCLKGMNDIYKYLTVSFHHIILMFSQCVENFECYPTKFKVYKIVWNSCLFHLFSEDVTFS
jgi:hypothetical protein